MWSESPACWVPSRGETEEHARRVSVEYEFDDPRTAARFAAQKYAEAEHRSAPFTGLSVRVRTANGTFDVRVDVETVLEFQVKHVTKVSS